MTPSSEVAVIVGAGPRLGGALGRRFGQAGMSVILASRTMANVSRLAVSIGGRTFPLACDATDEQQVEYLFQQVEARFGIPDLIVYNAAAFTRKAFLDTTMAEFETAWRAGCLGGFLVARAAAHRMLTRGTGSLIFTGNTASLRGGALFHGMAAGKFALRGLVQSIARELQPRGIHVAHVVVDGAIADDKRRPLRSPDALIEPDAIAETYYQLHRQHRSAWTTELDLRTCLERSSEVADIVQGLHGA